MKKVEKKWWKDRSKGKVFENANDAFSHILAARYQEIPENNAAILAIQEQIETITKTIIDDIKHKRKILLWGDYDVDGTCSILIWMKTLKALGCEAFDYHIPTRNSGYGLSIEGLKQTITDHKTVITMDNGITAKDESEWCEDQGIKLIVTDHHTFTNENITAAPFIFNPKLFDENKYSHLCGSGISYLICMKLCGEFYKNKLNKEYAELQYHLAFFAAMGTICDFVPLIGVNRSIFNHARKALMNTNDPALSHLGYVLNLKDLDLNGENFGYTIGPLINACGRMENMDCVIDYFMCEMKSECGIYFKKMKENLLKRKLQEAMTNNIINDELNNNKYISQNHVMFGSPDFHLGIVGLSATRYTNELNKPCLFYTTGDVCHGSGRSIKGINLLSILKEIDNLFITLGGHEMAFGFSFKEEDAILIDSHIDMRILELIENNHDLFDHNIEYDGELNAKCLDVDLAKRIDSIEPFGMSYPKPVFKVKGEVLKKELIGKNKEHSQVFIRDNTGLPRKIMFFFQNPEVKGGDIINILITISMTMWKGRATPLIKAVDSSAKELGFKDNKIIIN